MERAESDCEGERRRLTSSDYTTIFLAVLGKSFDVKPKGWVDWSTALGFFSSYSIIRGPCVKRACRSTKEETSKLLPSLGLFPIRNVRMLRSRDFEVTPWHDRCLEGYLLDCTVPEPRGPTLILALWMNISSFTSILSRAVSFEVAQKQRFCSKILEPWWFGNLQIFIIKILRVESLKILLTNSMN